MGKRRIPIVTGGEPDLGRPLRLEPPAESLDLHGDTVAQARARVQFFLARCARVHRGGVVRVITGRGLNSAAGARLRDAVGRLLEDSGFVARAELTTDRGGYMIRLTEE